MTGVAAGIAVEPVSDVVNVLTAKRSPIPAGTAKTRKIRNAKRGIGPAAGAEIGVTGDDTAVVVQARVTTDKRSKCICCP